MYWLRKKIDPNMAKNTNVTAIDAAENRGFLKKLTSSIGSGVWSSHRMNATSIAAPPMKPMSTGVAVQPWLGPSMIPNSSPVSAPIDSTVPSRSIGLAFGSFELGTIAITATIATTITGRLTRKTEPHQKWSSR